MVFFPNCKINLGLQIGNKREDNFHDLETVFYPILLQDGLEIIRNEENEETEMQITGVSIDGVIEDNICSKAYQLLKKDFPTLPSIKIHLHKVIPTGAGLGGGSADGAFTLLLLNKKFNLQLTQDQLIDYALQLGSDCPFFIINKPAFAKGRGELLSPINIDLSSYQLIVVNPKIHINTGWAFSKIKPTSSRPSIAAIISLPISDWKNKLINDFELPVFQQYPEIEQLKNSLYESGAIYSSMSGTGSTIYGIFSPTEKISFNFPAHYFVKLLT